MYIFFYSWIKKWRGINLDYMIKFWNFLCLIFINFLEILIFWVVSRLPQIWKSKTLSWVTFKTVNHVFLMELPILLKWDFAVIIISIVSRRNYEFWKLLRLEFNNKIPRSSRLSQISLIRLNTNLKYMLKTKKLIQKKSHKKYSFKYTMI